jgi:predicted metal-dependent hydrolase
VKSRPIDFDFSGVSTFWADSKEFALCYNGASLVVPPLEKYLCRCMIKAREQLVQECLKEDVETFVAQESAHYKTHIRFNQAVKWEEVDTAPLEKKLTSDYERFFNKRSLRFNLAYCEGFESTSIIPMDTFFKEFQELWKGTHPKVEAMWKWHFAEEFEHRNIVHDTYEALYGRGPIAWLYRVFGLWFCSHHMYKYSLAQAKLLLARYRKGMNAEELAASKAREKWVQKSARKNSLKYMLRIMSPFYSPTDNQAPDDVMKILALDKVPIPIPGSVSKVPISAQ